MNNKWNLVKSILFYMSIFCLIFCIMGIPIFIVYTNFETLWTLLFTIYFVFVIIFLIYIIKNKKNNFIYILILYTLVFDGIFLVPMLNYLGIFMYILYVINKEKNYDK